MYRRLHYRLILALRLGALGICAAAAFSGRYPPAEAQIQNSEDTRQDDKLQQLDEHLRNTDKTHTDDVISIQKQLKEQWDLINEEKQTAAHNTGIVEGFGILLTFMVGGSITLQVRKKS